MQQVNCKECLGKKGIKFKNGLYKFSGARYYEEDIGEFYSLPYRYGVWYSIAKPDAFYSHHGRIVATRPLALAKPYCFSTGATENIFPVALYMYLHMNKEEKIRAKETPGSLENSEVLGYFFAYKESLFLDEESAFQDMEKWTRNRLSRSGYDGVIYLYYDDPRDVFMFI